VLFALLSVFHHVFHTWFLAQKFHKFNSNIHHL
jgi:hypothetical protein